MIRSVPEISATAASKRFADVLDAVEHRGESFTIVRRGRVVSTVPPAPRQRAGALIEFLRTAPVDERYAEDVLAARRALDELPVRDPWSG